MHTFVLGIYDFSCSLSGSVTLQVWPKHWIIISKRQNLTRSSCNKAAYCFIFRYLKEYDRSAQLICQNPYKKHNWDLRHLRLFRLRIDAYITKVWMRRVIELQKKNFFLKFVVRNGCVRCKKSKELMLRLE